MQLQEKKFHIYNFYSVWVLFLHGLHWVGLIGNTFSLGVFVSIGWFYFSFIYPKWYNLYPKKFKKNLLRDICIHLIPLLFLKPRFENLHYIPLTFIPYLFFYPDIVSIYQNPYRL